MALLAAVVAGYFYSYDWEFRAMEEEIHKHAHLKIVKHWQHRDVTLEDFGFTVASGSWQFEINAVDNCYVRAPRDRASGLVVKLGDRASEMDVVDFSSSYWTAEGLPPISDIAEFLEHSDKILATLAAHPPTVRTPETYPFPSFRDYAYLVVVTKRPPAL
jgi:hypothetical protein